MVRQIHRTCCSKEVGASPELKLDSPGRGTREMDRPVRDPRFLVSKIRWRPNRGVPLLGNLRYFEFKNKA